MGDKSRRPDWFLREQLRVEAGGAIAAWGERPPLGLGNTVFCEHPIAGSAGGDLRGAAQTGDRFISVKIAAMSNLHRQG
jgi:hypothetical protein